MATRKFTVRRAATVLLVVATLVIGAASYRVVAVSAGAPLSGPQLAGAAESHLRFLRGQLEAGAGERMQSLFPEGYFFTHVLYGLSWAELGDRHEVDLAVARSQAQWALGRLSTGQGTAPFDPSLQPAYGVFYAGWSLLLQSKLSALGPDQPTAVVRDRIDAPAEAIAGALRQSLDSTGSPFLRAYPDGAWPVDTVVAVAALRAADSATGRDHDALIGRWLAALPAYLDAQTGLLPHRVDPRTGAILDGVRGSSQSLVQRFWPAIDPAGATGSYRRFVQQFLSREFGIVGVREFPHGVDRSGDVDSGPLLRGLSASASAVTIGAALANGDPGLAATLTAEAEGLGLPFTWHGERRYAGGVLPVGDALVVWARVTAPAPLAGGLQPVRSRWMWWLLLPWLTLLVLAGAAVRNKQRV